MITNTSHFVKVGDRPRAHIADDGCVVVELNGVMGPVLHVTDGRYLRELIVCLQICEAGKALGEAEESHA